MKTNKIIVEKLILHVFNYKSILVLLGFLSPLILTAQEYTWERYHTTYTGGHQGNNNYSSFVSPNWFLSGSITNPDHDGYSGFLTPKLDTRPPLIDTIIDVPNDQGRWVQITWDKSGYDESYNQDNFYSVWREDEDPGGKDLGLYSSYDINKTISDASIYPDNTWYWLKDAEVWTYIDQIPALIYDKYSYDAPTLKDSIAPDNLNYSTYKIVFHDLFNYYESEQDSGYSIDNLAPYAPVLNGNFMINHIALDLDENEAKDFQYFAIYKSVDPLLFPEEPYETIIDTVYNDYNLSDANIYYKVTAFDHNGNESEYSNVMAFETTLNLDLTLFLEGAFNGNNMTTNLNDLGLLPIAQPYNAPPWNYPGSESVDDFNLFPDVVDWILVELRDTTDANSAILATRMSRQAGFLMKDGSIIDTEGNNLKFSNDVNDNLFVLIWHRNHLGIMSASELTLVDGVLPYDFSLDKFQVHGEDLGYKQIGSGVWGMVTGDGNSDGNVNTGDKINSWNIEAGLNDYLNTDFDMNGQTNNIDKNDIWLLNIGKQSQVPE